MGPAAMNLTQFAPKAVVLYETTCNDNYWDIQGHSRSLILVPIVNHECDRQTDERTKFR